MSLKDFSTEKVSSYDTESYKLAAFPCLELGSMWDEVSVSITKELAYSGIWVMLVGSPCQKVLFKINASVNRIKVKFSMIFFFFNKKIYS